MVDINMLESGLLMPSVSETGAIVSFNALAPLDIKTLKIAITPTQSGTGDPSPTNIRPITGWTGANVYVSPTADIADATIFPASWSDSAGTVYGGTLDVVSGKLRVTYEAYDMGNINWSYYTNGNHPVFRVNFSRRKYGTTAEGIEGFCSAYKFYGNALLSYLTTNMPDKNFGFQTTSGWVNFRDDSYTDTGTFKTAMTGQLIVYPLATPVEYTLTPTEVQTLLGINNIWADCGDITLKTSPVFGKVKIRLMEEGISIVNSSPLLRSASAPAPDTEEDTKTEKEPIEDIVKEPVDEKDTVKELPEDENEPEPEDEEVTEDDNEG